MRIAVCGAGPGGLYFSLLMRKIRPECEITLYERNAATDAFGFGVVFSDETLTVFEHADPETYSQIAEQFTRWTDIDIHQRGVKTTSGGHGFSALGRRELLRILQERALGLGADVAFGAFKFFIAETEHGVVQAHAYPYDERMSTFIVEMHERTWKRLGLGEMSVDESVAWSSELFADALEGHRLYSNNSRWINFVTVRNRRWCVDNVVLIGDAAHTAHFSIGSGTKLAMEDAVSLAWAFRSFGDDVAAATSSYEAERRPIVESTQRAAQASLEWFEGITRYVDQERFQFAFNLLTRSRRVTYENLQLRDPEFVSAVHPDPRPPMFTPLRLRELELPNRVVVSPMDMYSAVDGTPGDFHLVHLGARALGGAGLVMTEMICVSDVGRITPGCTGIYRSEHVSAWERIVSFVHSHGWCAIGAQIGHSGRKGSTRLMWEGMDEPLPAGSGWEVIAPSAIAYSPRNQVPRAMTRADMDLVRDQFVSATRGALQAGFDLLEIHMAHGYLLSSFLSPVSNLRDDAYGGSLEGRARFPLEVLDVCRAVWPADRPLSVRISATDWVPGGFSPDDAVAFARMLAAHGCDLVDVSSGQVTPLEKPAFGRSYQTPFADRIRHEVGIPVVAVGAISSYDDVNTIIAAGRADLCALARPHLYDPAWTLHAAADQEFDMDAWVPQYQAGSRKPPAGRDRVRSELERTFDEATLISSDTRV